MTSDAQGLRNRWVQLVLGILAMIMIANLQYGWTLFVQPLEDAHGWSKAAIQQAFTFFVLLEVWLVPFNGWIVDRIGPRPSTAVAGVLVALGWGLCARADTLTALYLGTSLAGVGAGMVYGTMVGLAVKWFPERRGLAVGATAAGFGGGAALTVIPISATIAHNGYAAAFAAFGLVQGIAIVLISLVLRAPDLTGRAAVAAPAALAARQVDTDLTPVQMLRTPQFYLLYVMFTMIAAGLLFITAQVAPLAKDFGLAKTPLHVLGLVFATLPFVLIVDNVLNGGSRVLFGWLSDRIGREVTMALAFALEALGLLGLLFAAHNPWLFVVCCGATFVASGEIYSLFPASCTDLYGRRFATTNCGLLYTAKGMAALAVPWANLVHKSTGSWTSIILVLVAFNVLTALLAVVVLKPMRERHVAAVRGGTRSSVGGLVTTPVVAAKG